jgi:antirestriction protein ArdC
VKRSAEMRQAALARAVTGQSLTNYPAIVAGFLAKGIPEAEILPRENVLTFQAWKALGRFVRKGEHGVQVLTFIVCAPKADPTNPNTKSYRRPWTTTVFHVSQTEPIAK